MNVVSGFLHEKLYVDICVEIYIVQWPQKSSSSKLIVPSDVMHVVCYINVTLIVLFFPVSGPAVFSTCPQ